MYRLRSRRTPGPKPDSTVGLSCLWDWCTLNLKWAKRLFTAVVRKFPEGSACSGVVLVIRPPIRIQNPSQTNLPAPSKRDFNVTKLRIKPLCQYISC
ncbi:hypothetical protein AVEN_24939-1 [Araneus ventricosus]|uniref:Uncharacterized protein n=1 Tax=Araneus ventricosus TaxID=182803 RepID=A0A4Y2PUA2_ARAVE|nr:hypothetical protein AVEN_24939-1 [Araneus ventricosus]